ncbi:hypothetical protein B0J18DRAFT_442034 [Chaetomium sp. MPI-SDFR-AT-0129]|nr:hypothetical protein B0J18DRAFT_442034 [Chaetomium sp. MPI-SDFR-AT-0129]
MSNKTAVKAESYTLGFKKLSDQVYVQEGQPSTQDPRHPTAIVIYGWGDARPRHVAKYIDGYRQLYPHSKIVLIFSPILKALYQTLEARSRTMVPVIEAIDPGLLLSNNGKNNTTTTTTGPIAPSERVLLHVMSNTGGINCAATLHAYAAHANGASSSVFPHHLLVCDSTPGSTHFIPNIGRWSRAMALGATPRWFGSKPGTGPLFALIQLLAVLFLGCLHGLGWVLGTTSAAGFSTRAVNDPALSDRTAKRLYLYSQADDIIGWEDIEEHAADARQKGWDVTTEMFEGTPHVGHMRAHPEQYWGAIAAAWEEAVANKTKTA